MATETNSPAERQGAAWNALTHFILGPIFLITFVVAIYEAVETPYHTWLHWWLVVVAFALFLLALQQRLYSLRMQDRIIRLEERLRIMALVPGAEVSRITMPQFIALRFASDSELPGLVHRTLAENLEGKQIKEAIENWRRDDIRI